MKNTHPITMPYRPIIALSYDGKQIGRILSVNVTGDASFMRAMS